MSHWSLLDENNIVINVLVGNNDDPDEGYQWLQENMPGKWVKTSYNTQAGEHILGGIPFRKNFGGLGYYYDEERDAFIPPKPFESWILNEDTCNYDPPIPYPNDGKYYWWNEEEKKWNIHEL